MSFVLGRSSAPQNVGSVFHFNFSLCGCLIVAVKV